jgi:Flp pilus assembly pilin Flp
LKNYLKDHSAATAIEYALIASAIGMALFVIIFQLGDNLRDLFTSISTHIVG